jgi:small nuclear ribonucleoprotein (snRNP)-like protein
VLVEAETQFVRFVETVQSNKPIPELAFPVLAAYRELGSVNARAGIKSRLFANGTRAAHSVSIEPRLNERLKIALADDQILIGDVEGYLQYINLHSDKNTMRIYPEGGLNIPYVTCKFSRSLIEEAARSVNQYVVVTGEMRFRPNANHPYHVHAKLIETIDRDVALRPFEETRGIAKDHLSGSVDDYISEVRRGW